MANSKKLKLTTFKFKPFSEKQMKVLNWWTEKSPVNDMFMCIADGSVRSGKALIYSSILYTPDGCKKMSEIKVGDYVFNRVGKPVKVIGVFPQGKLDVYEVEFHDGSKTTCCSSHLWSYADRNSIRNGDEKLFTSTLCDIMKDLDGLKHRKYLHDRAGKYRFPINGCVEFTERYITEYQKNFAIFANDNGIPDEYKYNSKEVRLKVLADVINTDKSVYVKSGTYIMFCTTLKKFFSDVVEVARSLGLYVNTNKKKYLQYNKDDNYYCCSIKVNMDLYNLIIEEYKKKINLSLDKGKDWRLITSITHKGKEECQCIYVDDEEHLYLTDNFIVTHNTVAMALSFVMFMMNNFNQQNAAMTGKSVGSFRRNVLVTLKQMLMALDYEIIEHRSENYLEIIKGEVTNYFYVFGAKDESSQDLIQGITLAGLLIDEVALIPESFYNQATARLSIEGAKCFMNCNPSSPHHWFYKNVLKKLREKDGLYIHFTMDDNLSLSEEVKNRYKKMYSGVFAKRYVEGKHICSPYIEICL